ncbi:MAG: fumarylacetoacetate hydrolase family protein [SAR202 cluster bacterium]|nr:fumarylacetoacetate hydrolase family protein [SAR202 cluster bacterium]|tara:strand:- start:49311 stop:50222 length:912 start_codon:yes stop_codon:yes gene_type:complete
MKFVLFNQDIPGIIDGDYVIDISEAVSDIPCIDGQTLMSGIIKEFESYKDVIQKISSPKIKIDDVQLKAPLPEPKRLVCMAGNYLENGSRSLVGDRDAFLKSPSSVIGHGGEVILPDCPAPVFHHEAELGVVIGKTTKNISPNSALDHIFGYVNFMDISARGIEPNGNNSFFWGKSWDTFGPMGPCIVTKDEIKNPQNLRIRLWVNNKIRQDVHTSDMGRSVNEVLEFASWVTTLQAGDVVSTGTNHTGLGPIQNGDQIEMEITGLEKLKVSVVDKWNRSWPKETLSEMTQFESNISSKINLP